MSDGGPTGPAVPVPPFVATVVPVTMPAVAVAARTIAPGVTETAATFRLRRACEVWLVPGGVILVFPTANPVGILLAVGWTIALQAAVLGLRLRRAKGHATAGEVHAL